MRFLKTKIAQAQAFRKRVQREARAAVVNLEASNPMKKPQSPAKRQRVPGFSLTSEASRATKNISKNYGRAICSFALSPLALPYLGKILEEEGVSLEDFINYIKEIKGTIDGLLHFRSIILVNKNDGPEVIRAKRAFVGVSEVFIKYFSVNWIYNSRVFHKEAHLKFRFKVLRRIKNPELFTYLKESKREKRSNF